jgi:hypothetical protein
VFVTDRCAGSDIAADAEATEHLVSRLANPNTARFT